MPNYRRAKISGGTYFFTVVTYRRRPLFQYPESRHMLRDVVIKTQKQHPFRVDAWVLLPDHLHCIWTLPEGDADFSKRWGLIKSGFSKQAKSLFHREDWLTQSKIIHRESTLWQRRFWEHQIRNNDDFSRHMDYIHWNPVKHGYVDRVCDWAYSTFHRYVRVGTYPEDWGADELELNVGE